MNSLSTAARSSSMFILNPRFSDWITAPPRMRRKLPNASAPSISRANTSASRSPAAVMMLLA